MIRQKKVILKSAKTRIMKTCKLIFTLSGILLFLSSCDHSVSMKTIVHEDGSLDKTIELETDSVGAKNFIGIGSSTNWQVVTTVKDTIRKTDDKKFITTYTRHFTSASEANKELATPSDTTFRIRSEFDKKFRWFYTYISYSDTYLAINRLKHPTTDYFTQEDYTFIDRLPAEGKSISKADSLYLDGLNDKIFETYATRAIFEEYYSRMVKVLDAGTNKSWIDTLNNHKEKLFESLKNEKDMEDIASLFPISGISNIPISKEQLKQIELEVETLTDFASTAGNGKYVHRIDMPGEVVNSNADSVAANVAYWQPSATKFLLKDYKMVVESRQLNSWTVIVSIGFIVLFISILIRSKSRF